MYSDDGEGGSQIWDNWDLCGSQLPSILEHIGEICHRITRSQRNLGPHRLWRSQEIRKIFAFLCIVSSDTPVLDIRLKVSCLQGALQSFLTACWLSALSHSAGDPTGWGWYRVDSTENLPGRRSQVALPF